MIPFWPKALFVWMLLSVPIAKSEALSERERLEPEREAMLQERVAECRAAMRKAGGLPREQAIPEYGTILSRLAGWERSDIRLVFDEAQAKLLAIPGYTDYYRAKIEAVKKDVVTGGLAALSGADRDWDGIFEVLSHLPSEETMALLADYADDPFASPQEDPEKDGVPGVNMMEVMMQDIHNYGISLKARSACTALIGEISPRLLHKGGTPFKEDWWKDAQEGRSRYRFKGSDVWHPVNAPKPPEAAGARPYRRPDSGDDPLGANAPPPSAGGAKPSPLPESFRLSWPLLGAATAVLAALGYLFWKRKTTR